MGILEYSLTLVIIYIVLILYLTYSILLIYLRGITWSKKPVTPTNWPLIGMLPGLLRNTHRLHEFVTEILIESEGIFEFKGPVFSNLNMLFSSDPVNLHHMLSKNFNNYPKGSEYKKMFDIMGDGIFNVDNELWEVQRKITISIMSHPKFLSCLERNVWDKVVKGLQPVLDNFAKQGSCFDLQDIFQRFTFDTISKLLLDHDPGSLSIDLPTDSLFKNAFQDAGDAILYRHIMPESCWKLQKWLRVGKEKKLSQAWKAFDQLIYSCISRKQEEMLRRSGFIEEEDEDFDFLTACMKAYNSLFMKNIVDTDLENNNAKQFLRDTCMNLMFAGKDTTSSALTWFFWLLAKNPSVQTTIRDEIQEILQLKEDENLRFFNVQESRELVYLHGALCESLRLFPPIPLEHKIATETDILPSGHHLCPGKRVILSFYTMGRMETLWGNDCLDFKPERWISGGRGKIKHEPSFKFPVFNAGPRTCLGKDISFFQMKMVAATIIFNYQVQLVEGQHLDFPSASILLQLKMKHGLKVRLIQRSSL
ncbi:alkane hydroxylase MAH1-like [Nicotiana tabacum]|uniref:Alkane hydroxylase MAH1-like n=1 Tax=Nicotiana tabacum TaxID=4097 RepID=A0A1S4AL40_TOBAC|nr:PREDICTED: alkane hydroxylase MAH1-like [Nicotiana tabacum]